jgi:hypothetical protein
MRVKQPPVAAGFYRGASAELGAMLAFREPWTQKS